MVQASSVARVYSVMQESQQLREKICALSEKNRQLAKALTHAKQELTKARMAKNAAFSDKVIAWMDARCKPAEVQHQASQCSFEELEQGTCVSMGNLPLEPEPPFPPGATQTLQSDSQVPSPFVCMRVNYGKTTGTTDIQECEDFKSDEDEDDVDYEATTTSILEDNNKPGTDTNRIGQAVIHAGSKTLQNLLSPRFDPGSGRLSSQARRLRYRDAGTSYVEPKLNTKLRQGDYYGLGKRTGQQSHRHRPPKQRATSALSGQQCRRRTMRRVQHVSYAEPKLNTKLRQGDKFTFTT